MWQGLRGGGALLQHVHDDGQRVGWTGAWPFCLVRETTPAFIVIGLPAEKSWRRRLAGTVFTSHCAHVHTTFSLGRG